MVAAATTSRCACSPPPDRRNTRMQKERAALRPFCLSTIQSKDQPPAAAFSCGLASAGGFESSAGASRPRRFSSGSISGSRPAKSRNSCSASLLPPRESSVSRKWSPFSRVRPPFALEPLDGVGVEHFRPDVGVVAGRVAAHDVAEVRRAVARRHRREVDAVLLQRVGLERHHVRRRPAPGPAASWCQRWSSIAAPRYSVVAKPWLNLRAASTLSSSSFGIGSPVW